MKKKLLWSAIFTLIGTQIYAEPQSTSTPQAPTPAMNAPAVPTNETAPSQTTTPTPTPAPVPTQPATPAVAPVHTTTPNGIPAVAPAPAVQAPVINCEYKIPAQTKNIDQKLVISWAQNALVQAFTFDPLSLDAQMQKLQPCFTEQGWTGFSAALQKSGNIEAIKSQKLTVTSQINGPVLVTEAKDNQWKLTVPLTVTYQNEKEKVGQLLSVDLTIGRKINGDLGITQMIAAPRGTVTTQKPVPAPANPSQTTLDTHPAEGESQ